VAYSVDVGGVGVTDQVADPAAASAAIDRDVLQGTGGGFPTEDDGEYLVDRYRLRVSRGRDAADPTILALRRNSANRLSGR